MDRLEDQANTEDGYSRTRDGLGYDDPPEIWNSGVGVSASEAEGVGVVDRAGPAAENDGLEYPAHPVVGIEDGELLFSSSDLPSVVGPDLESPSHLNEAALPAQANEAALPPQADLSFVERRSQPWLGDDEDTSVGGDAEGYVGSEPVAAAAPWPTLDDSDVANSDVSFEAEPSEATDLSAALDLNADGQVGHERGTIDALVPGDHSGSPSGQAEEVTTDEGHPVEGRRSCRICTAPVSQINMKVDGNVLILESCDECDSRRWRLDGQPIDLKQALDEVGEHAGRRS